LKIVSNPETSKNDFIFSGMKTIAGINLIHVTHINTNSEVANSPFAVRVLPSTPNATITSHNLEFDKVDTTEEVDLLLKVFPADRYNNLLSSATGYTVTMKLGSNEETFDLKAPSFSHIFPIEKSFEGKFVVSFMYNGDHVNNSPMTITGSSSVVDSWTTKDIILVIMAAGAGVFLMLSLIYYLKQRKEQDDRTSQATVMAMLFNCIKNFCMESFDIFTDYFNYLEVVSNCSALALPYKTFLGLASVASLYSMAINGLQMRKLTNKGVETLKDDLHKSAIEFRKTHVQKAKTGMKTLNTTVKNMVYKVTAIHPAEGEDDENEDITTTPDPDWVSTLDERCAVEIELFKEKLLRDRLYSQIFILSLEDIPFLLMNLDLIAGSGFFGCSDVETTPLFVFFTVLAAGMSGIKFNKVLGLFGKHGIKQKIKDLTESVEKLTAKGLMQRRRRASEIDLGAMQEANAKAALVEKDEIIAQFESAMIVKEADITDLKSTISDKGDENTNLKDENTDLKSTISELVKRAMAAEEKVKTL